MNSETLINKLKQNRLLSQFLTEPVVSQLKRYLITGFSSAAIEMVLLWIMKDIYRCTVVVSNTVAYTVVFWFNFLINRFWSFESRDNMGKQVLMYGILFIFNLGASDIMMYLLTDRLGVHYLIAKAFAIGVIVSWNFIFYKKVIFK